MAIGCMGWLVDMEREREGERERHTIVLFVFVSPQFLTTVHLKAKVIWRQGQG